MKQARNSSRQVVMVRAPRLGPRYELNRLRRENAELAMKRDALKRGARTESPATRTIPVRAELIRLVADCLHTECGDLDSDYVFS